MALFRDVLPQLAGDLYLTDGGLETTLIFHDGLDLPEFAAYILLDDEKGRETLRKYFRKYLDIARDHQVGFILESMTFRTSKDWGDKIGHSEEELRQYNHKSIQLLEEIRKEYADTIPNIVISGCIGPRGDGYSSEIKMTVEEAEAYHSVQIQSFSETEADMVAAYTIPYIAEGIGIALAAKKIKMPAVISFTVETDGNLPSGELLKDAIDQVDEATDASPVYFMVNCAHPTHFLDVLDDGPWGKRIRAIRANASTQSHAELDEATELDDGNPLELGKNYLEIKSKLENLNVFGGCCGTDHRHLGEICNILRD